MDKAFAHMSISEVDEADRCYDEVLKIEPNHAEALGDKGTVQFARGNYREALLLFDKSLKIEPNNAKLSNYRRVACEKIADYN